MGTPKPDDFTIGGPGLDDDETSAAVFLQESNQLRIERLGNRITIVSVIIPCIICAILLFAYMDIKKKVMNVHDTGQTEVLGVAENLDTKINAMTVDLAGVKHRFETTVKPLESETARLESTKAEKSVIKEKFAQVEAVLIDRTSKDLQKAVQALENSIKKELEALKAKEILISEALAKTDGAAKELAQRTGELEKEIKAERARTAVLEARVSEQNQTMTLLQKELSLVKIKADTLEQTSIDRKVLDRELKLLEQKIDQKTNMIKAQTQAKERLISPQPAPPPSPSQPKPSDTISEKDLLQ